MQNKGFTLIELMVSMVIIGLVFGIIFTSTIVVRKNARDTQRQSDLKSIQSALELYHADQLYYPTPSGTNGLAFGSALKSPDGTKTYMSVIPSDPLSGNSQYFYSAWTANDYTTSCDNSASNKYCNWYLLCAKLENPPSGISAGACSSPYNLGVTP